MILNESFLKIPKKENIRRDGNAKKKREEDDFYSLNVCSQSRNVRIFEELSTVDSFFLSSFQYVVCEAYFILYKYILAIYIILYAALITRSLEAS